MTVASENSMLKHRNIDLNTVSLKANDCTCNDVKCEPMRHEYVANVMQSHDNEYHCNVNELKVFMRTVDIV
jgi:hypothetical protein